MNVRSTPISWGVGVRPLDGFLHPVDIAYAEVLLDACAQGALRQVLRCCVDAHGQRAFVRLADERIEAAPSVLVLLMSGEK